MQISSSIRELLDVAEEVHAEKADVDVELDNKSLEQYEWSPRLLVSGEERKDMMKMSSTDRLCY